MLYFPVSCKTMKKDHYSQTGNIRSAPRHTQHNYLGALHHIAFKLDPIYLELGVLNSMLETSNCPINYQFTQRSMSAACMCTSCNWYLSVHSYICVRRQVDLAWGDNLSTITMLWFDLMS